MPIIRYPRSHKRSWVGRLRADVRKELELEEVLAIDEPAADAEVPLDSLNTGREWPSKQGGPRGKESKGALVPAEERSSIDRREGNLADGGD
jgi:hypothetical protein